MSTLPPSRPGEDDETVADEAAVDATPADENTADEVPADEVPADEVAADAPPADEVPADATAADATSADGATETPTTATEGEELPDSEDAPVEHAPVPAHEHVNRGQSGTELASEHGPAVPADEPAAPADEPAEDVPAEDVAAEIVAEPAPPELVEPDAAAAPDAEAAQAAALADAEAAAHPDGLEFGEAPAPAAAETPSPPAAASTAAAPTFAPEAVPLAVAAPTIAIASAGDPPRARHNRGFGVGIALLSSLVFAALYVAAIYLLLGYRSTAADFPGALDRAFRSEVLIAPVAAFIVLGVLAALLANRARWWAHVLLSLIVGILVYGVGVASALLVGHVITMTPEDARPVLVAAIGSPEFIAAGIIAREVALWFGLATSARGRRVVARNAREREDWERADAEARGDAPLA